MSGRSGGKLTQRKGSLSISEGEIWDTTDGPSWQMAADLSIYE